MIGITEPPLVPITLQLDPFGEFSPQPDITPLESALLLKLFAVLLVRNCTWWKVDFEGFVKQHGLERHFDSGVKPDTTVEAKS